MNPTPILLTNLSAATMQPGGDPYGMVADGALVVARGRVDWVGPRGNLPLAYTSLPPHDMGGRLVLRR